MYLTSVVRFAPQMLEEEKDEEEEEEEERRKRRRRSSMCMHASLCAPLHCRASDMHGWSCLLARVLDC